MKETFEPIDRDRRLFFGVAAVTLAAAQLGLIRPASAQSKAAGQSDSEPDEFLAFRPRRSGQAGRPSTCCGRAPAVRCCCSTVTLKPI